MYISYNAIIGSIYNKWKEGDMNMDKKTTKIILIIGIGLLATSLLADVIGLGINTGFGPKQTTGTIAGLVIAGVGLFLWRKAKDPPSGQPD